MNVPLEIATAIAGALVGLVGAWLTFRGKLAEVQSKERARVVEEYQHLVEDLRTEQDRLKAELQALRDEFTNFKGRRAWCDGCANVDKCMSHYKVERQRLPDQYPSQTPEERAGRARVPGRVRVESLGPQNL